MFQGKNQKKTTYEMDTIRSGAMAFARIGIYRYAFDGTVLFMDETAFTILELKEKYRKCERIIGKNLNDLFGYRGLYRLLHDRVQSRGEVQNFTCTFETLNGVQKTVLLDACVVNDEITAANAIQVVMHEVTGREKEKDLLYRLQHHQAAILKIATDDAVVRGDFTQAVCAITAVACEALRTQRVGVWLLSDDRTELRCIDSYEQGTGIHSEGMVLRAEHYPAYFRALESGRAIDAHDARTDARTREFNESYLLPMNVSSMLDAAIRVGGKTIGVVCHEQTAEKRTWQPDEIAFAGEIADQIAQLIISTKTKVAEDALSSSELQYRSTLDSLNDGIHVVDKELRILIFNSTFRQWNERMGLATSGVGKTVFEVFPFLPEAVRAEYEHVFHTGELMVTEEETTIQGKTIITNTRKIPVFERGNVVRVVTVVCDITSRKMAQKRLEQLNACFLDFSVDPIENVNRLVKVCGELLGATCAIYNCLERGLLCSVGMWHAPDTYNPVDKPEGHICYDVIQRDSDEVVVMRNLPETPYSATDPNVKKYGLMTYVGKIVRCEEKPVGSLCVVYQRDHEPSDVETQLVGVLAFAIGIEEERRLAAERMRQSLREKEVLLKEIHHRVKNNLQIVSSLLNLQSRAIRDETALDIFKATQQRVKTMAIIHERLYHSTDFAQINLKEYAERLVHDLVESYHVSEGKIRTHVDIDNIVLDIETSIPCGLIVNELVTNILKYAFPDDRSGEIFLSFKKNENGMFVLTVRDTGVGFPEHIDFRNTDSLGLQLVTILVKQLNGTFEMKRENGTEFVISIPESSYA